MTKQDEYQRWRKKLETNACLSSSRNDTLALAYIDAKYNGGYGRLLFNSRINSFETVLKKIGDLRLVDRYIQKDFDKLTEDDVLAFRNKLNAGEVTCRSSVSYVEVRKKGKKSVTSLKTRVSETSKPLAYRSRHEIKVNFREFYRFVMEYHYQENKKLIQRREKEELKDVTRYFHVVRPPDYEDATVEFIPDDERRRLLKHLRPGRFKAAVQLALMSGARPCELVAIRYGVHLYKNDAAKWVVHLPRIKGISYKKFPFEIDLYEEDLTEWLESLNLKHGDMVFPFESNRFRERLIYHTEKYLGKRYTPKILRKTARIIRGNAGYSNDWIEKLMGHVPGSKVQKAYVNHFGIKDDPVARERLRAVESPTRGEESELSKLKSGAQEDQIRKLQEKLNHLEELAKVSSLGEAVVRRAATQETTVSKELVRDMIVELMNEGKLRLRDGDTPLIPPVTRAVVDPDRRAPENGANRKQRDVATTDSASYSWY